MPDIAGISGKAVADVAGMSGKSLSAIAKVNGITKAAQSGGSILTTNLVQHLDAGDSNSYGGTGTTWYDISGNGGDVQFVNGPTYSSTEGGGSISFDGVNDQGRIYSSDTSAIRPSETDLNNDGFTVQAWIKMDVDDSGVIWGNNMYSRRQYYGLQVNFDNRTSTGGRIVMHKFDGDGNYASYSRRSAVVANIGTSSAWQFVTWRYDSASNTNWYGFINDTKYYLNTPSGTGSGLGYFASGDGNVATQKTSSYSYTDVQIAMILVYDAALTDTEVTDNYDATKARFGHS